MSKRSKKENELLNYLSEDERKVYEEFEAKLKAKRDVAVKRQKKSTSGKKLMNVRKKFISTFLKIAMREMQSRKQNLFRHKFHIRKNLFQLKM